MATLDLSKSLISADAEAATDWGSVSGGADVEIRAIGTFSRGIDLEIGAMAMGSVDAGFRKFLAAKLEGRLQAQARAQAQVQVPLNLFNEVGLAVRLQAIAEAAAGVRAEVGISVEDFLALVDSDPRMRGLPSDLFRIFLDEITVGAGIFAKAAFTAQAYANLSITGTALSDPANNIEPGFNIVAGCGAGLEGGAGYRVFARVGFDDFSRYIGRSVDVLVDRTVDQLRETTDDPQARDWLDASRVPAKISLRTAYEMGEYIALHNVPRTAEGAQKMALRCSQVVLEECQRFLLEKLIEFGLDTVRGFVVEQQALVTDAQWDALLGRRQRLAFLLQSFPAEPFRPTPGNLDYWNQVTNEAVGIALDLGDSGLSDDVRRALTILWSATQLMFAATKRVVRLSGSVELIGVPLGQAAQSFEGPLDAQPHALIGDYIRSEVSGAGAQLTMDDLLVFLTNDVVLDLVREHVPAVDAILEEFKGPIAAHERDVARLFLISVGAISTNEDGDLDNRATLVALLEGLDSFVLEKMDEYVIPLVRTQLPARQDVLMYFDEVMVPSIRFATEVAFVEAAAWVESGTDKERLTEALSGVLMKVIGRSLVVTGDVLLTFTQTEIQDVLEELADQVDDPGGVAEIVASSPLVPLAEDDLAELLQAVLLIGADVFAPFPPEQRARIRALLYQIIDPVPPDQQTDYVQDLADAWLVPVRDAVDALAMELVQYAWDRFVEFSLAVLDWLATTAAEEAWEFFVFLGDQLTQWFNDLVAALAQLEAFLVELANDIAELAEDVAEAVERFFDEVADALAELVAPSVLRDSVLGWFSGSALGRLTDNVVYTTVVPASLRSDAQDAMNASLSTLVGGLTSTVSGVISDLEDATESILADARSLDPDQPLAPQVSDLLLDRMEAALWAHFGLEDPSIDLAFDFGWEYTAVVFGMPTMSNPSGMRFVTRTANVTIDLGEIAIPLESLVQLVRNAALQADPFLEAVEALAQTLIEIVSGEATLADLMEEQADLLGQRDDYRTRLDAAQSGEAGLEILSPAHQSGHDADLFVDLRVTGVPESWIFPEDGEPSRLAVVLNGQDLPVAEFTVVAGSEGALLGALAGGGLDLGAGFKRRGDRDPLLPPPAPGGGSDLVLRARVPLEELEDGMNTLVATLLRVGAPPMAESVSFAVMAPADVPSNWNGSPHRKPLDGLFIPGGDPKRGSSRRPREVKGKALRPPKKERATRERTLKRGGTTAAKKVKRPMERLVSRSPRLADYVDRGGGTKPAPGKKPGRKGRAKKALTEVADKVKTTAQSAARKAGAKKKAGAEKKTGAKKKTGAREKTGAQDKSQRRTGEG